MCQIPINTEHRASEGRDELFKLIRKPDDVDVAKNITEMSQILLAVRNEQFSRPLPEKRVTKIAGGQIKPFTVATMLAACQNRLPDWIDAFHRKQKPLMNRSVIN